MFNKEIRRKNRRTAVTLECLRSGRNVVRIKSSNYAEFKRAKVLVNDFLTGKLCSVVYNLTIFIYSLFSLGQTVSIHT